MGLPSFDIVSKAFKVLPVLIQVIGDVDSKVKAAKAATSDGGTKVTALEVVKIIVVEVEELVHAIAALYTGE